MEMPPVSNVMPLPTSQEPGPSVHALGLIAQNNQRGRLRRSLRDAPECAHLQFAQLIGGVHLPPQAHLQRHLRRALPQNRGRQFVARLIDQRAREVLALANNHALATAASVAARSASAGSRNCQALNALVLALATIGIGIEISHQRTLNRRSRNHCMEQPFGGVLRQRKRQLPNPPRLGKPHRRSRCLPHAVHRALAGLPSPTISSRLAASPAGAWIKRVSFAPALYSPVPSTPAAAASTAASASATLAAAWRQGLLRFGCRRPERPEFGSDPRNRGKRNLSPHAAYSSRNTRHVANAIDVGPG